jgi:hypothetical protein
VEVEGCGSYSMLYEKSSKIEAFICPLSAVAVHTTEEGNAPLHANLLFSRKQEHKVRLPFSDFISKFSSPGSSRFEI